MRQPLLLLGMIAWLQWPGLFTLWLQKQEKQRGIDNDPKAQQLLDRVSTQFQSYKTLETSFSLQVYSKDDGLNENFQGRVWLKGDKYRIETDQYEILCDNVKRYVFMRSTNEVQIQFYDPQEGSIESPAQLFTIYKKDFYYRLIGEEITAGKKLRLVELIPKNIQKASYRKITLFVDETSAHIQKAKIDSKDGILYTWQLTQMKPNQPINEDVFTFNKAKYPGARIEDMTR